MLFPRNSCRICRASHDDLANVEVEGLGFGLHWPAPDADLYVPALVAGIFGTRNWVTRELARRAGQTKSSAKAAARRTDRRAAVRERRRTVNQRPGFRVAKCSGFRDFCGEDEAKPRLNWPKSAGVKESSNRDKQPNMPRLWSSVKLHPVPVRSFRAITQRRQDALLLRPVSDRRRTPLRQRG